MFFKVNSEKAGPQIKSKFLSFKETKSSFEIEHLKPNPSRTEKLLKANSGAVPNVVRQRNVIPTNVGI